VCRSSSGPSTSAPYAPNSDGVRHRFAAVNLVTGTVEHAPTGAPEHSSADRGHPPRDGCALGRRSGAVRVRVSQGSQRLWDLVVVVHTSRQGSTAQVWNSRMCAIAARRCIGARTCRSSTSSTTALSTCRAAARPIRLAERGGMLRRRGRRRQPGYRACPRPAKTIFEAGTDRGNFRGVAFYIRSRQPFIVSELAAGWYRYVSEWRLALTGMIRPRFGFNGVRTRVPASRTTITPTGASPLTSTASRAAWINRRDEHKETTQPQPMLAPRHRRTPRRTHRRLPVADAAQPRGRPTHPPPSRGVATTALIHPRGPAGRRDNGAGCGDVLS